MDNAAQLGQKPIPKLLLKFSIPAITGMLVQALYNIVDGIFVGRGVGTDALAGLTTSSPFMMIMMGFAMLAGVGGANYISIKLGENKKEDAQSAINHVFVILIMLSVLVAGCGLIFKDQLLVFFGAKSPAVLEYAKSYMGIILLGTPFMMLSFGLNHCTRAQGFPLITMLSMLIGAITNCILDAIFIFVFGWGVEGAALATIISQFVSMVWMLIFNFGKKPVVSIKLKSFNFDFSLVKTIFYMGSAQFAMQIVMSVVSMMYNNGLHTYGEIYFGTPKGSEIAQSAFGIVNYVMTFTLMPIFGINQGSQPVLGFNYGAKKFKRVKKAWFYAVSAAVIFGTSCFVFLQLFPEVVVSLFTKDASLVLHEFTVTYLRIASIFLPTLGFQIVSSNYFNVTGRPKISLLLSMLRQLIVLLPCIIILPKFFGLMGIVFAQTAADFVALILTIIVVLLEVRKLSREIAQNNI